MRLPEKINQHQKYVWVVIFILYYYTNYHKLSGLKKAELLSYSSVAQKSKMNFTRLKPKSQQGYTSF